MRRIIVALLFYISWQLSLPQVTPKVEASGEPKWQVVDQVCGQVELATPTKKKIVVDGKTETRSYETHLIGAEVGLYRGSGKEKKCCENERVLERTRSDKYGSFYFSAFRQGFYWVRIQKGSLDVAIPLRVTRAFDKKSCHDHSVGRLFIADAHPPGVEVRIY